MSPDIEPEEVEKKDFLNALRGYDREQVDAYLREIATELRRLRASSGAPAGPSSAADMYKGIGEKTSQILVAAEEAGEEIKSKARDEAARVLADSRMEASELARTAQIEKRQAEDDIRRLRDARNLLKTQLEDVGRRLEEMISRLDAPLEIPDLTETPAAPAPAPTTPAPSPAPTRREPPPPPPTRREPPPPPPTPAPETRESTTDTPIPPAPPAPARPEPARPARPEPARPAREPVGTAPSSETGVLTELKELLDEVRSEREASRHEVEEVLSESTAPRAEAPIVETAPGQAPVALEEPLEIPAQISRRSSLLGDLDVSTSSKLKRALQEDQNVLLDRLRTNKKGTFEETYAPIEEHRQRFFQFLREPLESAYRAGLEAGGASNGEAAGPVEELITKQLVAPLRKEVSRIIEVGMEAQDTPSSISDRAGDVYRVWKGVRTELLGEGMSYAAFHQGLTEAWRKAGRSKMVWILSGDEIDCPRNVCRTNAEAGAVEVGSAFPSGHLVPPAHGGCSCSLGEPQ